VGRATRAGIGPPRRDTAKTPWAVYVHNDNRWNVNGNRWHLLESAVTRTPPIGVQIPSIVVRHVPSDR